MSCVLCLLSLCGWGLKGLQSEITKSTELPSDRASGTNSGGIRVVQSMVAVVWLVEGCYELCVSSSPRAGVKKSLGLTRLHDWLHDVCAVDILRLGAWW